MWNYNGKVCVVTGAASGMGKATTEMLVKNGAEVYALDVNPVAVEGIKKYIYVDLCKKESIDKAFEEVPAKIDCFFGIAGLKGLTMAFIDVAKINLISNKYICQEILPERMVDYGAIALVTSVAGVRWEVDGNLKFYKAAVEAEGWDNTVAAIEATGMTRSNNGFAYVYTKLAANYLVSRLVGLYGAKHVRVNAIMPGDTATNFGSESGTKVVSENVSPYAGYAGRAATAEEMAYPLLFLNSDMASFISGAYLFVDCGACGEILGGLRGNPVGVSIEDNIMKAMAARKAQQ